MKSLEQVAQKRKNTQFELFYSISLEILLNIVAL